MRVMSRLGFMLAAALMPLPAMAVVVPVTSEPTASLRLISGSSLTADWYGKGAMLLRKQLCITSSSSRFQLTVDVPSSILGRGTEGDAVEFRFTDATGAVETKRLGLLTELTFVGATLAGDTDCSAGANATIEIYVPENALLANQSGSYFEQISLAVRPL